jgi:hypothetical protein
MHSQILVPIVSVLLLLAVLILIGAVESALGPIGFKEISYGTESDTAELDRNKLKCHCCKKQISPFRIYFRKEWLTLVLPEDHPFSVEAGTNRLILCPKCRKEVYDYMVADQQLQAQRSKGKLHAFYTWLTSLFSFRN